MSARFTPQRIAAFRALWRAISAGRKPGAPTLGERASALPRLLGASVAGRYPGLGRGRLALFVLAAAYLVSPIDVIPELLFNVFGLGDDAVVALWLAGSFLGETERYLGWEREQPSLGG
ncbi:YkvA family protein [Pseudonocardia spinosispora]|uniref:YkvA family protein n=1 Tax=Pseudonocardia spinosispora TaxID=103441 RepID=UPI00042885A9|nr:YkvA family protein [Pseudonocardia spinosispora]